MFESLCEGNDTLVDVIEDATLLLELAMDRFFSDAGPVEFIDTNPVHTA
ncbi:MAG TPA: hypothetical protein VMU48_11135 [Terracidiphilus sp.]|nr:hypothetical protein [Terracidiphilus sp.]